MYFLIIKIPTHKNDCVCVRRGGGGEGHDYSLNWVMCTKIQVFLLSPVSDCNK